LITLFLSKKVYIINIYKLNYIFSCPTYYSLSKEHATPRGKSIFTPMENDFSPSPENFNKYNKYIFIPQFFDYQSNNFANNNYNNCQRRLFQDYDKVPTNMEKDSENIPTPKKNNTLVENEKNQNGEINANSKKFFTDYGGYGYKCSCSKTNCNRYYCECYRSRLYCIDCNCKNCQNKPPKNSSSNRHSPQASAKPKSDLITCTCTKSACNKKYCECFKNGAKCNVLCRCVACENNEKGKKMSYECCMANSIYIIKNKIFEEEIEEPFLPVEKNSKILLKKRKRTLSTEKNNFQNL